MVHTSYTIRVTLVGGQVHTFKDISHANAEKFKQVVWVRGVTIKVDELTKEQVSPYRITEVLIKVQSPTVPPVTPQK
jgi:hypothetical protein